MLPSSLFTVVAALYVFPPVQALLADGLTAAQINAVRQIVMDRSHVSWEYGTATTAVLELDYPDISVYGPAPFPPPRTLPLSSYIVTNANKLMDERPATSRTIMEDSAAGDPMSNAITLLLANFANPSDTRYMSAFYSQLGFIEYDVPRTADGAISHRVSELQLWSDSAFMVPPVFAYWGALQTNLDTQRSYLRKAYDQLRLYRNYLRDPTTNAWKHVLMGSWSDPGLWTTGQGWAAAGMLRVHQTIAKSALRGEFSQELTDLVSWTREIVAATWSRQRADGSLGNYLRDDSFTDMSGTTLMATVTYRLAVLTDVSSYIPNADKAFTLVKNSIGADGKLPNVVNPYDFSLQSTDVSPEGQSFVLMCQAAWRDYTAFVAAGSCRTYTAVAGDTCTKIATKFGTTVASIIASNPSWLNCDNIWAWTPLTVCATPVTTSTSTSSSSTSTSSSPTSTSTVVSTSSPTSTPSSTSTSTASTSTSTNTVCSAYTAQSGDNCTKLASRFGTTVASIKASNPSWLNCDDIWVNTPLTICVTGGSTSTSTQSSSSSSSTSGNNNAVCSSYSAKAGDTCTKLATQFGTTVALIKSSNPSWLNCDDIWEWTPVTICVPSGTTSSSTSVQTSTPTSVQTSMSTSISSSVTSTATSACVTNYAAEDNETCITIGTKFGLSATAIFNANTFLNCNTIWKYTPICIPAGGKGCSNTINSWPGATCANVASAYGTTESNIRYWNKFVDCASIWTNTPLCVAH